MTRDEAVRGFLLKHVGLAGRLVAESELNMLLDLIEIRAAHKAVAEVIGDLTRMVAGKVS